MKHEFLFKKATHKLTYVGRKPRESAAPVPSSSTMGVKKLSKREGEVDRAIKALFSDFQTQFKCTHVFCKDCAEEHKNHFVSGHSPHLIESRSDPAVKGEPKLFLVSSKAGNGMANRVHRLILGLAVKSPIPPFSRRARSVLLRRSRHLQTGSSAE